METETLSLKKRIGLILDWSVWLYENTESFSPQLALDLAYLWPAILRGAEIEVNADSELLRLIRSRAGSTPTILYFIRVRDQEPEEPPILTNLRQIVAEHTAQRLDPRTGRRSSKRRGILVDATSAAVVLQVYEGLGSENRSRLLAMPFGRMVQISFAVLERARATKPAPVEGSEPS